MEDFDIESEHPKKRRRRLEHRKLLSARLVFDERSREDAAVLSEDLLAALDNSPHGNTSEKHIFLALAPSTPWNSSIEDTTWTIIPSKRHNGDVEETLTAPSTVQLPLNAPSTQAFLRAFQSLDVNRHTTYLPKSIDVRIISALPLDLETIYVTVEKGMLQKVDEIQNKFGGGFISPTRVGNKKNGLNFALQSGYLPRNKVEEEDRLTDLVRLGLSKLSLVHTGDIFPLPLPAHPITHVAPPPAVVAGCEPVLQGRVSSRTKIILVQAGSSQEKAIKHLQPSRPVMEDVIEDEAEDTSNEQFYSATEDRTATSASEVDGSLSEEDSVTEESSQDQSESDSDDSMDDMISMNAPGLPPQQSGTLSAMTAATPRPGRRATGTHTPGSIYSSFTAAATHAGSRPGKVFRTEALLKPVPREALHPKPASEDDDEAFVFVDTSTLAKIGCFSGDWVRVEVAKSANAHPFASLSLGGLSGHLDDEPDWRAVRVFGLSGLPTHKPRYAVDRSGDRRSSFSRYQGLSLTPIMYLPPILLNNLGNTLFIKVGVLAQPGSIDVLRSMPSQQVSNARTGPPMAKEVTLLKISTPVATSRELQASLFSGLKRHFASRKRILKRGDLVAISVDEEVGKATATAAAADSPSVDDDLLSRFDAASRRPQKASNAWFRVEHLIKDFTQEDEDESSRWGSVATVDSSVTRMSQAGSSLRSIPQSTERNVAYWLGQQKLLGSRRSGSAPIVSSSEIPEAEYLPLQRRLRDLIAAATSPRAINLGLPPLVVLLHSTQRQIGKTYTAKAACAATGIHTFSISAHDLLSENASTSGGGDVKTEALLKARAERALTCGAQHTALLLQHIDVLTADRMIPALQEVISAARVLMATTTDIDKIPDGMRSLFTHELEITAPNESDREVILRNACLSQNILLDASVDLQSVALKTAALVAGDLVDVVNRASLARSSRLLTLAEHQNVGVSDILIAGGPATTHLLSEDFTAAISHARNTFSDSIGAPKIPTVKWEDVGGLADQKSSIMETISLPLSRPELFANGIRKRSGILFYGPPGTGKTLLAKAIATEFSLNFFSVKGPELLNMYIGESEANVRRVFQRARDARPCVVFFDELDSVAPKRGNQGDSGGVMDRIVSQLLAELDGMSSSSGGGSGDDGDGGAAGNHAGGVFVIGATNRPDLLDPALLRPGRFDKMLYLGVAATHEQQATILEALTRKFSLAPGVDLRKVAATLPFTYTGADLYALASDAMLKAITRKTRSVDLKVAEVSHARGEAVTTAWWFDHCAEKQDLEVVVTEVDFDEARRELVGSVSAMELAHFEKIRQSFEEADGTGTGPDPAASSGDGGESTAGEGTKLVLPLHRAPAHAAAAPAVKPQPHPPLRRDHDGPAPAPAHARANLRSAAPPTVLNAAGKGKAKGKAKAIANPDSGPESGSESDEYVIKTGHLGMNGSGMNGTRDRGKGKGLAIDGFLNDAEDDEDLYG